MDRPGIAPGVSAYYDPFLHKKSVDGKELLSIHAFFLRKGVCEGSVILLDHRPLKN